ncbi:MAG: M28 family peptidase [Planctomycetota bacterium]
MPGENRAAQPDSSANAPSNSLDSHADPDISEQGAPLQTQLSDELESYVSVLADEIGERNLQRYESLNEAADWIEGRFVEFGYSVERQSFEVNGLDCHNLIAERIGTALPDEIIIIGAHYDSFTGTPGANDNGSGTAAMLTLARKFADVSTRRTLRFVAFTNEEPPYFQREDRMGSLVYARRCRRDGDNIRGVLSLETMGYFDETPGSQEYPPPLNLMYPDTGNFIGFVGNLGSRDLLHRVIEEFRKHSEIPSEGASLPSATPGVGWSDHWSFWQEEYPGIMITDTAPFRYPHYHLDSDTVDKIDFDKLSLIVTALEPVILDLADN